MKSLWADAVAQPAPPPPRCAECRHAELVETAAGWLLQCDDSGSSVASLRHPKAGRGLCGPQGLWWEPRP